MDEEQIRRRILIPWDPNPHYRIASENQTGPVFTSSFVVYIPLLKHGTWKAYVFIFKMEGKRYPRSLKTKNKKKQETRLHKMWLGMIFSG